jgi:NAD-dependent DNA ligase
MNAMTVPEVDSSALRSSVAFTGNLACMSREKAFEVVRRHGGTPSQTVTRQTNVLVVGEVLLPSVDRWKTSRDRSLS